MFFPHTRNAGTPYPVQHSTRKKSHFQPRHGQTTRDVHTCTSPYRITPCHNAHHAQGAIRSILCTRFSTQRSTLFHAPQPRSYRLTKATLSSVAEYVVLAYHTHIRLRLPVCLRHHVAPTLGHRAIFYLIRPLNRGTLMGTSHGIFLFGSCAFVSRRATLLIY